MIVKNKILVYEFDCKKFTYEGHAVVKIICKLQCESTMSEKAMKYINVALTKKEGISVYLKNRKSHVKPYAILLRTIDEQDISIENYMLSKYSNNIIEDIKNTYTSMEYVDVEVDE